MSLPVKANLNDNPTEGELKQALGHVYDTLVGDYLRLSAVADGDLLISLLTAAGNTPSIADPATIRMRHPTLTNGYLIPVDFTAATQVELPGGGTLGAPNSVTIDAYIWAVYDGTNKDIGISRTPGYDESALHSTTTIGTGSDATGVIYTTTGRTNAVIRLIGKLTIAHGVATWDTNPTVIHRIRSGGGSARRGMADSQLTTSGTSWPFNIPSWATEIELPISGFSTTGSAVPLVQIGDAGGFETTSYTGGAVAAVDAGATAAVNNSTGYAISGNWAAGRTWHGIFKLVLMNVSTNTWVASFAAAYNDTARGAWGGGSKSLSGPLTQVRLITTDAGDAGELGGRWAG